MGMSFLSFTFEDEAPTIDEIAACVEKITELTVKVDYPESDNHCTYAELSFAVQPHNAIEISIGTEVLNISFNQEMESMHLELSKEDIIEKYKPNPLYKKPSIFLHGGMRQEPTLVNAICASLVQLGGIDVYKYSDGLKGNKADNYPISEIELKKRRKSHKIKSVIENAVFVLLLPIIIPLNIIFIVFRFITDLIKLPRLINEIKKDKV